MIAEQVVIEQRSQFSGPVPPPEMLAEYERIVPGSAHALVEAFTSQTKHRQGLERTVVEGNSRRADLGLKLGFVAVVLVLGSGMWLVNGGHTAAGTVVLSIPLPTLAGVFVYGKRDQRRQLDQKRGNG